MNTRRRAGRAHTAFELSRFNAENADGLARVHGVGKLSEGDQPFRWWSHLMVFLHAETYHRHRELGLMTESHWEGYRRFVRGHLDTPGVTEFRADVGPAFSREFSDWIPRLLAENAAAADRPARLQPAAAGRPGLSPAAGGLE